MEKNTPKRLPDDPGNPQNQNKTTNAEHGGNQGGDENRAKHDPAGSSSRGGYPSASQRNQGGGPDSDGTRGSDS